MCYGGDQKRASRSRAASGLWGSRPRRIDSCSLGSIINKAKGLEMPLSVVEDVTSSTWTSWRNSRISRAWRGGDDLGNEGEDGARPQGEEGELVRRSARANQGAEARNDSPSIQGWPQIVRHGALRCTQLADRGCAPGSLQMSHSPLCRLGPFPSCIGLRAGSLIGGACWTFSARSPKAAASDTWRGAFCSHARGRPLICSHTAACNVARHVAPFVRAGRSAIRRASSAPQPAKQGIVFA